MSEPEQVEEIVVTLLPEPDQPDPGGLDLSDNYVEGPGGQAALAAARDHQGRASSWSGTGPAAVDLSGLTGHAAKEADDEA